MHCVGKIAISILCLILLYRIEFIIRISPFANAFNGVKMKNLHVHIRNQG